jgi:hypothetical protein
MNREGSESDSSSENEGGDVVNLISDSESDVVNLISDDERDNEEDLDRNDMEDDSEELSDAQEDDAYESDHSEDITEFDFESGSGRFHPSDIRNSQSCALSSGYYRHSRTTGALLFVCTRCFTTSLVEDEVTNGEFNMFRSHKVIHDINVLNPNSTECVICGETITIFAPRNFCFVCHSAPL